MMKRLLYIFTVCLMLFVTLCPVAFAQGKKDYSHLKGTSLNVYNWGEYTGYPSNMIEPLTSFNGYVEVEDDGMWTNGIEGATDEECNLIREVFSGGVLLNWEV